MIDRLPVAGGLVRFGVAPDHGSTRAIADRFARDVTARRTTTGGVPTVEVRVRAVVPPLGLWGPGVSLDVEGHGVQEPLLDGAP